MKSYQFKSFLLIVFLVLLVAGCRDAPLELAVQYASLGELTPDNVVYVGETRVGQIEKIVSSEQGGYLVKIVIDPEYKNRVTEYSHFYLSGDPFNSAKGAIVIEQGRAGGALLASGTVVTGEKRGMVGSFLSRLQQTGNEVSQEFRSKIKEMKEVFEDGSSEFNNRLEKAVEEIGRSLDQFQESWNSGEVQQDLNDVQEDLDRFIEEFKRSGEAVQKKMREEMIPALKQELQDLEKKLRQENRDNDADQVEQRLGEIARI